MRSYSVKEIFYTLQGEGANAGRPAVFCRFAGCNLWTGREAEREDAICQFCDTDFVGTDGPGGGRFSTARDLAQAVTEKWPDPNLGKPLVVCTGGEPLLQMDDELVREFHTAGFEIAIETNGTILPPDGIDWICVSPKAGSECILTAGDELKVVFPQAGAEPDLFDGFEFRNYYVQPMDGPSRERNTQLAIRYCMAHPKWKLSLQTHKLLGIP